MDAVGDFFGEQGVNHAMARDAPLAVEARRRHLDAVMSLTAGARAGVPGVEMGFVGDGELDRIESGGELGSDAGLHGHRDILVACEKRCEFHTNFI